MVDGLALCSCACVTCLWCSLLVPRACTRLDEMKSMQFVCSRCSATGPHRHQDDSRGSCRILKPTPRGASQRGCFVPSADKDRPPIQPKPAAPAPQVQQTICVRRPKEKPDSTQDDSKTKGTTQPDADNRPCTNVVPLPNPQRAGDQAPSKPPASGGNCTRVPPPKPPRQGLDPKYPIAATPKKDLKTDSKDSTRRKDADRVDKPSPADGTKQMKKDSGTKKEPDRKGEKPSDECEINRSRNGQATVGEPVRNGATRPREDSRSGANAGRVPPPKPVRQGLDPKYPIAATPKTNSKTGSKDATGRKAADRADNPSLADGNRSRNGQAMVGEPVRNGATRPREDSRSGANAERVRPMNTELPDDREMNRSNNGQAPEVVTIDESVQSVATRPREDSRSGANAERVRPMNTELPDDREMNRSNNGQAPEVVTIDESVQSLATRPREDSGSVHEIVQVTLSDSDSDSDSDSVYESARGSDSDSVYESARGSDSDSDSAYEMALESLVDDEQARRRRAAGTIGRGDVGRTGNDVQTTPMNRWRKRSWPGVRRAEGRMQMESSRSGPSRLHTSI